MSRKQQLSNPVLSDKLGSKLLMICIVCDKPVEGYYARFGEKGTCSKTCMRVQDTLPRYPGHTSEEFDQRMKG